MSDDAFTGRLAPPAAPLLPLVAPALLGVTGSLLAVTIIISGLAARAEAPVLWFLTVVMGGAGAILMALAVASGQARGPWRALLVYSLGSGAFMAAPSAMGYLSVAHVGAGYISITFAFPVLLTYLLALGVGMDRFSKRRCLGVAAALAAGLALALSKAGQTGGAEGAGAGWIILASAIPLLIAFGNLYRTRFWPDGASPLLLAALMLLSGALLLAPFAAMRDGGGLALLWQTPALARLVGIDIAIFCVQYVAYFRLQRIAGPVYLSQLGSVAAITGASIAATMGEALPPVLPIAVAGFALGLILFHRSGPA